MHESISIKTTIRSIKNTDDVLHSISGTISSFLPGRKINFPSADISGVILSYHNSSISKEKDVVTLERCFNIHQTAFSGIGIILKLDIIKERSAILFARWVVLDTKGFPVMHADQFTKIFPWTL